MPLSESIPASLPALAFAIIVPPSITRLPFESMASPSSASFETIAYMLFTSIVSVFLALAFSLLDVVVFKQSSPAFIT